MIESPRTAVESRPRLDSAGSPIVNLDSVGRVFRQPGGDVAVLKDVNLSIRPGEFLVVTGPSGSGKSTLMNLVSLLDQPSTGSVRFQGQVVSDLNDDALSRLRREKIGMVFQGYHLLARRCVLDNLLFRFRYCTTARSEAIEKARQAAEMVGIAHLLSHKAYLLSGGEMQRVAIARAIALNPSLLIADEPTGNLDSATSRQILDQFGELHRSGMTIMMVTHNMDLLRYATRHLVCGSGRLAEPGHMH